MIYKELPNEDHDLQLFASHYNTELKGSIIDFGCGDGNLSKYFLRQGLRVHLVDTNSTFLDHDVKSLIKQNPEQIDFIRSDIWDIPTKLKAKEWIFCREVLEYLPPEKILPSLREMARRTQKGGYIKICLHPHDEHHTSKPAKWWLRKIAKYWKIEESSETPYYLHCVVGKQIWMR